MLNFQLNECVCARYVIAGVLVLLVVGLSPSWYTPHFHPKVHEGDVVVMEGVDEEVLNAYVAARVQELCGETITPGCIYLARTNPSVAKVLETQGLIRKKIVLKYKGKTYHLSGEERDHYYECKPIKLADSGTTVRRPGC